VELLLHGNGYQARHAVAPSYRWLETSFPALHNKSNLSTIEVNNILASNLVLHAVGFDRTTQLSGSTYC
jgi:hypothetical protein